MGGRFTREIADGRWKMERKPLDYDDEVVAAESFGFMAVARLRPMRT